MRKITIERMTQAATQAGWDVATHLPLNRFGASINVESGGKVWIEALELDVTTSVTVGHTHKSRNGRKVKGRDILAIIETFDGETAVKAAR